VDPVLSEIRIQSDPTGSFPMYSGSESDRKESDINWIGSDRFVTECVGFRRYPTSDPFVS
jgi:hypothetical protein